MSHPQDPRTMLLAVIIGLMSFCSADDSRAADRNSAELARCWHAAERAASGLQDLALQTCLSKIGLRASGSAGPSRDEEVRIDDPEAGVLQLESMSLEVKFRADVECVSVSGEAEFSWVPCEQSPGVPLEPIVREYLILWGDDGREPRVQRGKSLLRGNDPDQIRAGVAQSTWGPTLPKAGVATWVLVGQDSERQPLRLLGIKSCRYSLQEPRGGAMAEE